MDCVTVPGKPKVKEDCQVLIKMERQRFIRGRSRSHLKLKLVIGSLCLMLIIALILIILLYLNQRKLDTKIEKQGQDSVNTITEIKKRLFGPEYQRQVNKFALRKNIKIKNKAFAKSTSYK